MKSRRSIPTPQQFRALFAFKDEPNNILLHAAAGVRYRALAYPASGRINLAPGSDRIK